MAPRVASLLAVFLLAGCSENPSVLLDPAGPHAEAIGRLFWVFFAVAALVWFLVLGAMGFAMWRGSRRGAKPVMPREERSLTLLVGASTSLTALIIAGLVLAAFMTDKRLTGLDGRPAIEATLTGHQWWWEIRYEDPTPSNIFTTANELHVPVGQTVKLTLNSSDVIHSVWIPNLAGKRDIVPGRSDSFYFRADKPGTWRGRCGEFCGLQHSFMELLVVAHTPDEFRAWQAAQRRPASQPAGVAAHGKTVFETGACALCHVIRGTAATGAGALAPDLTHLMSRRMLGAGAALNTPDNLRKWIADPHKAKPGVRMPPLPLGKMEMQALISYLETLK